MRNCAEPWALPARVHSSDDQPVIEHGAMFVFGSLAVIVIGERVWLCFFGTAAIDAAAMKKAWEARR